MKEKKATELNHVPRKREQKGRKTKNYKRTICTSNNNNNNNNKKKQKKGFQSKRCDEYYSDLAFSKRKIDKVVLENMNMQNDFGGRLRKRICYKRKTDNNNNNE